MPDANNLVPLVASARFSVRAAAGLMLAAGGAIAFSGKAIIVKLAYRHGVDAVTLIMYRMLFAMPLFVALAWWAGRGKPALTARDWRENCDRKRTDGDVRLRAGAWYRRRLDRGFTALGGGVFAARRAGFPFFELETA